MARFFKSRPGLVVYLTCGDPDLETTAAVALAAIEAGADVIELGVPFSDPVADGPIIQRASERALARGTTLKDVLHLAGRIRAQAPTAGLIIFSYYNPILRFGIENFCAAARDSAADGALVTDLTVEEAGNYRALMHAQQLATVFLAAPTSTDRRLKHIAAASEAFVYAVSRAGITGTQAQLAADASALCRRLRKFTKLPIAVGFGISTPQHFREVGEFADAAVVGSAIVQLIERSVAERRSAPQAVAEFVRTLRRAPRSTKTVEARSFSRG